MSLQFSERRTRIVFSLSLLSLLCLPVAGLGVRLGFWHFGAGINLLLVGLGLAGIIVLVAPFTHLKFWRIRMNTIGDFVIVAIPALLVLIIMGRFLVLYGTLPAIHNISTDTQKPPQFVHIVSARGTNSNPLAYKHADPAKDLAQIQRGAYPEIQTIRSDLPRTQAFSQALEIVDNQLGWDIVDADAATGFIEATDTSFWFGFKDDVVIRVEPDATGGSRIDLRSVSRVGQADFGANAKRIHAFIEHWQDR